jgi:hypothetical protein
MFSNQKCKFGQILEGLELIKVGIFYAYLEYTYYGVYWSIFYGHLVI